MHVIPYLRSSVFLVLLSACATAEAPPAQAPEQASEPRALPSASEPTAAAQPETSAPIVDIPNARQPLPGIVTGGAPSDAQLRQAKELGYRTVISLLPEAQSSAEATVAAQLGLRFVSIPIAGADDLTEANARRLGDALRAPDAKPLILHCASGNRAGALLALEAFYVEGKAPAEALALGEEAGLTKLRGAVEERLASASGSK